MGEGELSTVLSTPIPVTDKTHTSREVLFHYLALHQVTSLIFPC